MHVKSVTRGHYIPTERAWRLIDSREAFRFSPRKGLRPFRAWVTPSFPTQGYHPALTYCALSGLEIVQPFANFDFYDYF
jgi:hypothetical protein